MNVGSVRLFLRCSIVKLKLYGRPVHSIIQMNTPHHKRKCRYFCSPAKSSYIECEDSHYSPDTDEFEENSLYDDVDFSELTSDPAQLRTLKIFAREIESMYQRGEDVPERMSMNHWAEFLAFDSQAERMKYLRYLKVNETTRRNAKIKKSRLKKLHLEKKAVQPDEDLKLTTSSPLEYGLGNNTLFSRIGQSTMNRSSYLQLFNAMRFGSHIVIDCSYEPFMARLELSRCASQFLTMWSYNKDQVHPYHIVFCNVNPESVVMKKLGTYLPQLHNPDHPLCLTSKNYLDLYPKEQLVYLTPDADDTLLEYKPNDIYIIGGYVDRCRSEALSLAKAKQEGLRTAKFPLDMYLKWAVGVKSLTLNQVLAIMIDVKDRGDWKFAFRHIPSRKIQNFKENPTLADQTDRKIEQFARAIRERYRRNLVYDLIARDA